MKTLNWDLFKLLVNKYDLFIDGFRAHSVKFDESEHDAYEADVEIFHDWGVYSKFTSFTKSQIEDGKIWEESDGATVSIYNLTFKTRPSIVYINGEWKFL